MNVISIPLDMIDAGERLRQVDEDYAALIAAAFEQEGQRQPIEVRSPVKPGSKWRLLSGAHRLRAAGIVGLPTIFAIEMKVSDLEARLREVDENLVRHELSPLDRASFLAVRKEVWEELHPETGHGKQSGQVGHFDRFSVQGAEKLGISERSVRRAVKLFRAISPDVRAAISGTWLAWNGSQLEQLARLTLTRQRQVAVALKSFPGMTDVGAIVRHIDQVPAPPPPDPFEKFVALWAKSGAAMRARIRAHIEADARARGRAA